MRLQPLFVLFVFVLLLTGYVSAQETSTMPVRTPEQEALAQTERMQKELGLNTEQVQLIYEINLRHARERTVAGSRSQALERIRVKDSEMQAVLTRDQHERLQQMRTDRHQVNVPGERNINTSARTRPIIPSNAGTPTLRANPRSENAIPVNPANHRENARSVAPSNRRNQENSSGQASPGSDVRRAVPSTPPQQSPPRNNNNQNSGEGRR